MITSRLAKFALFVIGLMFSVTFVSAQEVVYDNTSGNNNFRMIVSSEKSCAVAQESFWASFYLIWGGNQEMGDYHLSIRYCAANPCSIEQGGLLRLILKDGMKINLSCDEATTSEQSSDPFVADVPYPHEICCMFTVTKLQLRQIIALGVKSVSLELSPKEITAQGEFKDFGDNLSTMLHVIDVRKLTKSR